MIHKTTRSILSVLLAALLLVTSIPLTPAFAGEVGAVPPQSESGEGPFAGGTGTADDPYQIATANDLREFAKLVNDDGETTAWAELTANIDLNSQPWYPIGNEEHLYTGTFDGNGHTISGLYIDSSSPDFQGLFGCLDQGGTVQDLTVSGSVSGHLYVGGVVGYNNGGTVTGCIFSGSGSVSGNRSVGGVVGYNGGNVENCYNISEVSGNQAGGVVGYNGGNVENCHNTGTVSDPDSDPGNRVGGVVGWNISSGNVKNCYNTGKVTGSSSVGGVVGYNGGSVTNCYNTGTVSDPDSGTGNRVGGVVGWNISSVTNCYNTGKVIGSSVGGVVGYNSGSVTGCYFLQGTAGSGIGNKEDAEGAAAVNDLNDQKQFKDWDFIDTWRISQSLGFPVLQDNAQDGLPPGLGTEASPYEISTADELENFRNLVNNGIEKSAHAKLMNNIDLKDVCGESLNGETSWEPIGTSDSRPYRGTFDGNGKTIENLYINNTTSANDQGLFGYLGTSGDNKGTVQNLSVSGNVSDYSNAVGGVVGQNDGGSITDCAFSGSVSGKSSVGGVVGDNVGTVENCYNTGEVTGSTSGGVVGMNGSGANVENCYNTGSVNVTGNGGRVGGVVGYNYSGGNVTNCYNTGGVKVTGNDGRVGGVVGWNSGNVTNCYNTGGVNVRGNGGRVGGVVGWNDSGANVENCYNTGSVSGNRSVGGVVGYNDNSASVANCYYQTGKGATVGVGGTTGDNSSQTEIKSLEDFHSGEVAYLLQSNQTASSSQVWGQAIGEDDFPVLSAESNKTVYQVKINLKDSADSSDTLRYTNSDLQALTPTREGYTFDGWYESADCSGEAVTTITDTTATLYAKWTPNTYQVTLHTNDGTIAEGQNVTSYIYGVGAKLPTENEITKTGYIFAGWYNNADLTGDPVTEISKTDINDKAYWAKWEEVENPDPDPDPTPTPDPEPSGPSTGDSTGWDDIRDELENAENGDEITIDMGDETKVPAEIFETLAGQDITLEIALEGGVTWTVNGQDIPADANLDDLDLGVEMDSDGIPVDVVNAITGERDTVQMTLAHNGEFGFTMTLTAPLGKENAGYWANLYHYDEDAEQLTFETAAEIDADGSVSLPMSHASQYAIVIDTHSHAAVDVSDIFLDVAPNAWYKDAVQYAYDNGLMTGVSATEFAPEATTTRAMIVSILARLENVTTAQAAGFADVDDEWYATAVNWAANVGVVNGYEDNTFQPNTAITREQLAAILMNYAAYKGYDVSARADLSHYSDADSISSWANDVLLWAVAEGLLTGVTDDTIAPQAHATRAQVAAILQRFLSE